MYLCVHNICICVCECESMCLHLYILACKVLYCVYFYIHPCTSWCSCICSSTSGCMCTSVWPSSCLWMHVCEGLHKSVCMRMNFFGWLSGWMHPCVHVQVFTLLCVFEDSMHGNFACLCVLTCLCPCLFVHVSVVHMLIYVCMHTWLYTQVTAQACVCEGVLLSALPCLCAQANRHAYLCTCVSLGFFRCVCGSLCLFVQSCGMCAYVYICIYVSAHICTSFCVCIFVSLYGCESLCISVFACVYFVWLSRPVCLYV